MDLDRDKRHDPVDPMRSESDLRPLELETTPSVTDRGSRGSSTLALILGGLVIAIGLFAFVFYPGGTGPDVDATGTTTTTPTERPALPNATAPTVPSSPNAPAAPAPATPAPGGATK